MRLPDPESSRAVLIGASHFGHPELADLPSVRNNLAALADIFTVPHGTGLPPAHCRVLPDPADIATVGNALEDAADEAEDALIVYYAGHGLVEPSSGELYLALPDTNPDRVRWTGLPFSQIRTTLLDARADNRVLLLDCCFSGRAVQAMTDDGSVMSGQIDIAGTYTLTAAPANTAANAPADEDYTAFSGELIAWLREGDAAAPLLLTLGDTYLRLRRRLTSRGLPEPQQHSTQTATLLALARNAALTPARDGGRASGPITEGIEAAHLRRAQAGDSTAMRRLAELLTQQGRSAEAEDWYRRAAAAGDASAMIELGLRAEKDAHWDQAASWFRQAIAAGDKAAMLRLGALSRRRHRLEEAETWYRQAAESGDAFMMNQLADLCQQLANVWKIREGDHSERRRHYLDEAETWLRKASRADPGSQAKELGEFFKQQGQLAEAEVAFRTGANAGDTYAMYYFGMLLAETDRLDEAETWYRRGADAGNHFAMRALGQLAEKQGDIKSAESWYRRAAERGDDWAIRDLDRLLKKHR